MLDEHDSTVPIIFDEPTTALDVTTQIEVLSTIKEAVRARGVSAIYITHDLAVVAQVADRIMVLRHGDLVEEGDARTLLDNPQEEYTRKLLAVRSLREDKKQATENAHVLEIKNIFARYPRADQDVLTDISMEIPKGKTVAVVGESGSGKSTLAKQTTKIVNAIQQEEVAVVLPMDGYHYTRARLDAFEDPEAAHARRGAHWTFDAEAFVQKVEEIARNADSVTHAPTFDHGEGDPVEGGVCIEPHHSIVFVEGLYLLLDIEPWKRLRAVFDEAWYIDVDIDEAMRRLFRRQTRNGDPPGTLGGG